MTRRTDQRRILRQIIESAGRPLTIQEMLELAQEELPTLGQATVYRNVKRFVDEGLLAVVAVPGEPGRYEVAGLHHHHHFHCDGCGKMYDLEGCASDYKSMLPPGFKLARHEITLYGSCEACNEGAGG